MKAHRKIIVTTLLPAAISAYDFTAGYGFGDSPSSSNASLFRNYTQHASIHPSVPLQIGSQQFRFQVNVTQFPLTGADIDIDPAWGYQSIYALTWTGDDDLNTTVRAAEGLTDGQSQEPRLCATVPMGLFSTSVTNGYTDEDNGSCEGALGKKCVDAITSSGFGGVVDDCTAAAWTIPDECQNKFPDAGLGSASVLTNVSQSSPAGFAFYSQAVSNSAGLDEKGVLPVSDAGARAESRLYMVIFADKHSYHPVCLRPSDNEVEKSSPATGGAARLSGGLGWSLLAAFTLLQAGMV